MNQLLFNSPVLPKTNQIVKGNVIEIGKNTVFVDLGSIGTGVILGREIKENQQIIKKLKSGDEIFAMVLDPENDNGFIELSLKAANKQTAWEELKNLMESGEPTTTTITKANKGGLMVEIKGVVGFLPVSQLSYEHYPRIEDGDKIKILNELNKFVGKNMVVKIIDVDPEQQKLIISEKVLQESKLKEALSDFKIGDLVEGTISGVVDFGAFVRIDLHPLNKNAEFLIDEKKMPNQTKESQKDEEGVGVNLPSRQTASQETLPPSDSQNTAEQQTNETKEEAKTEIIEGLIHISEIDWQLIEDPREFLKVGQKVQAKIIGIKGDRLSLSLKALREDPWLQINEKYQKGQIVKGQVTKFNPFGAFVQLDKDIHGLIHISEFRSEQKMKEELEIDKEYEFKILSIEPKVHKMALTLVKDEAAPTEEVPKTE